MDVLCNGTPFLSWAWAPISLILRVASEHLEAFDHIIKGYSRIAECLGRFSMLNQTFRHTQDFQQTLAVFYADILEFHKNAYQFVRRSCWKLFFVTSWHRFQRRFDNILEDLQRHEELIDKEANAHDIAEAKQMRQEIRAWREDCTEKLQRLEEEQSIKQYNSIMTWLKADETDQLNIYHMLLEEATKYPGTCDWVLQNKKMASTLQRKPDHPLLWVQGAAGTGKSVLSSSVVNFMKSAGSIVLSHFCNYAYPSSTKYDLILQSLLLQLVRKDGELAAHVYENYVLGKKVPSIPVMERLLQLLLPSISKSSGQATYVWIIVDGIDECESLTQNKVFSLMSQVTSIASNSNDVICKALVSCRFSASASAKLRKKHSLSLTEEKQHMGRAIRRYSVQRLQSLYSKFQQMNLGENDIREIESAITYKADGMFLYARLVLDYLSSNIFFSGAEIMMSVHELPEKLSEFYTKILTQILVRLDSRSINRVKCALGWIAFSKRPLKKIEFLSAIAFSSGDTSVQSVAPQYMLDMCASMIEERPDSRIGFIHVSVKDNLVLIERDCLLQHGIATATCLLAAIEAFPDGVAHESVLLSTVKGLHGFQVYSKEHWTDYLLSLAPSDDNPGSSSSLLFNLNLKLAMKLNDLSTKPIQLPEWQDGVLSCDQQNPTKFVDERIGALRSPLLQGVVQGCLKARSAEQLELTLQQFEASDETAVYTTLSNTTTSAIPTPQEGVSILVQRYQTTIRYLLDQTDYPGVTAAELDLFKRQFRDTAYTCRVRGCPRATDGFDRQAQCHEHEILHVRRLMCPHMGCPYPPFVSSQSLKRHVNKDHNPTPQRKAIRKVGNMPSRVLGVNTPRAMSRATEPTKDYLNTGYPPGENRYQEKHLSTMQRYQLQVMERDMIVKKRQREKEEYTMPTLPLPNPVPTRFGDMRGLIAQKSMESRIPNSCLLVQNMNIHSCILHSMKLPSNGRSVLVCTGQQLWTEIELGPKPSWGNLDKGNEVRPNNG
ncbi:hypothetical protein PG997_005339 [Apiospora hydei]|uniref:NACHT domain-containing protein n=1 Tax=Apiospora hydei TaxID=1337664 RepID=A0ABR1X4N4_9PEZI